jgi:hypothetical protein
MEAVVWEPVTRSQHRIAFPPEVEFDVNHYIFNVVVLSAAGDYGDGYVHNDLPFKLVLLFNSVEENLVCACVYESESGKWGNISSIATPTRSYLFDPGVLVRNALYWFLGLDGGGDILEFDLDTQSLAIIHKPPDAHFTEDSWFRVLSTKDRGLCLAIVSTLSIQLWVRNVDSNGVFKWVFWKTVELDKLLSLRLLVKKCQIRITGFDEDSCMIFLSTARVIFTIQLESLLSKKLLEVEDSWLIIANYPYRSFYTAGKTCLSRWAHLVA